MEVIFKLERMHYRLQYMKIIGHDIGIMVLNLLYENLIIGQKKNITTIYGEDHEILKHLGDE